MTNTLNTQILKLLRCPISGTELHWDGHRLASETGETYKVSSKGIPLFAERLCTADAKRQQAHYDKIASAYAGNRFYPHTQEYTKYLDQMFVDAIGTASLGTVAEICCGWGEAFELAGSRIKQGFGVDISVTMLELASSFPSTANITFVQGDATNLPLCTDAFDTVIMLGGIHHVADRKQLFLEVARILKPGGRFLWREPVSDFWLWRVLRGIIYRISPILDHETERPLLFSETKPFLDAAGLNLTQWKTYGFIGFCLFMNSDVLFFNRIFRYIPGIRSVTQLAARMDHAITSLPMMQGAGLQVIGIAQKPREGRI